MRILYWLITAPLLVFAASFAISNRGDVTLSLLPLPFEITVPLAAVGLIGLLLGAVIGMLITWANGSKARSRARATVREVDAKRREISQLNEDLKNAKQTTQPTGMKNHAVTTKPLAALQNTGTRKDEHS